MTAKTTSAPILRGETRQILTVLKTLMKRRGLLYKDLAPALGVSLPTVKRMMTDGDLSLDRLLRICDWLAISLHELMALVSKAAGATQSFSIEQEEFFAVHPHHLAYFFALRSGKTPADLERAYGLSRRSTRRYLRDLEGIGLVERQADDRARVRLGAGTIVWEDRGPLGRTYARHYVAAMAKRVEERLEGPSDLYVATGTRWLTDRNLADLRADFETLVAKYRVASDLNRHAGSRDGQRHVSYLFVADEWDDPFFQDVRELA
jgi:DNA-binding MarR family transcriptional regulator